MTINDQKVTLRVGQIVTLVHWILSDVVDPTQWPEKDKALMEGLVETDDALHLAKEEGGI